MRQAWLLTLSALIIVVVAGCQQAEEPGRPAPPELIQRANLAVAPSLLTLARNPGAFEGQDLILAGNYERLPVLVCAGERHASPATWALSDGEVEILASGFDSALRELASPGLPLEVEGRWQRWEGPVGCGRRAPSQLVWHLQLTSILSPNPLSASVGFNPEVSEPTATVLLTAAVTEGAPTPTVPTATAITENPVTEGVATIAPSLPGTQPSRALETTEAGSTANASVVPTTSGSGTLAGTPLGTATPTTSLNANTPTPTVTSATPGSTATPTVARPVLLNYDDLSKRNIAAGGLHEWQFAGATDLAITIRVAPSSGLDVALELLDPSGKSLNVYDVAGAGQTETVNEANLPAAGLYTVQVTAVGQSSGNYALVLQSESSRPFVLFQGLIGYGETRAGTTPEDGDHLWNFEGQAGDVVNVRVIATTQTDMQIYFNSHDGQETEFVDDNTVFFPPQDREEILGLRLPANGLYTVGIGEEDLNELGYTITIERAS